MSEPPLMPFPPPTALETLGSADAEAGLCVDGVCFIPPADGEDDDENAPEV